jgi:hypothetical protein
MKKALREQGLDRVNRRPQQATAESLQLGFFVFDMLASLGIKLHDRHFLGHGFFVLAGGVEMTGTSRRFELDFLASAFGSHDVFLSELGLATCAQVGEHGVNAIFVDQTQGGAGHAQAHPTVLALDPEPAVLQVGHEAALGFVVGVGNVVPNHRAFARDFTFACHEDTPFQQPPVQRMR